MHSLIQALQVLDRICEQICCLRSTAQLNSSKCFFFAFQALVIDLFTFALSSKSGSLSQSEWLHFGHGKEIAFPPNLLYSRSNLSDDSFTALQPFLLIYFSLSNFAKQYSWKFSTIVVNTANSLSNALVKKLSCWSSSFINTQAFAMAAAITDFLVFCAYLLVGITVIARRFSGSLHLAAASTIEALFPSEYSCLWGV